MRTSVILAACSALLSAAASAFAAVPAAPLTQQEFSDCVQALAQQTPQAQRPVQREEFERIASTARYDDRVRQALLVQAGEPTFWWDDIAATTDDERAAEGREILARNAALLGRIEARFNVPREVLVAIYGIETNYGRVQGRIPVLDAALSVACLRPCPPTGPCIARERAYAAVRMLRDRKVPEADFNGSWAAAFGRTQFVPDTLELIGVDFDADGMIDIVHSEADAWASTANHLRTRGGWVDAPVYVEVLVPAAQQAAFAANGRSFRLRDRAMKASEWAAQGWQALGPGGQAQPLQVAGDPELHPFLPVGLPGPAFLVSRNFNTILRYNVSERYVMEVAVLANKLAGGPGIVAAWPTDDPGLTRAQVRQLQAWLQSRGYTQVTADGVMGRNTRDAIEAERLRAGLPPGRRVGQRSLQALMNAP